MAKKKRGGQPGNTNALKHGLWANRINKDEAKRLKAMPITNIEGEIAYLRIVTSRLALILEKNGFSYKSTTLPDEETIHALYTLNMTMGRLLTYVKTHALLSGDFDTYEREMEEAKRLARLDLNVNNYYSYPAPENE